ncbi:MAG: ATP-binding protein [Syntrophobacteraceae bacterium]
MRGQEHAKQWLEVAAAGSHNLITIGPPGSAKTMPAPRPPSSVLCPPSSVFRLPFSVFRPPSSVLRLPSSVLRPPSSVLRSDALPGFACKPACALRFLADPALHSGAAQSGAGQFGRLLDLFGQIWRKSPDVFELMTNEEHKRYG